ncbi:MAG TPA: CPBP family intramembrane glutamic endopeptidase [Thermoanaerobaculia bacterium]|nr:CPBP family intramembrane glutamic endopeptidase [Thermoanaerobaculia bacterium]
MSEPFSLPASPPADEPAAEPPPPPEPATAAGPLASLLLAIGALVAFSLLQTVAMLGLVAIDASRQGVPVESLMTHLTANMGWSFSVATLLATPPLVVLAIGGLYLLARRNHANPATAVRRHLGLGRPHLLPLLLWALVTTGYVYLFGWLGQLLDRPPLPQFMIDFHATAGSAWLLGAAVVIGAPVVEELLFRGVVLPGFVPLRHGRLVGVLLSAFLWAGIHLQYDLFDMSAIFVLGLIFGAARLHDRSLWTPFLLHALFNLAALAQLLDALGPIP